MNHKIHDSLIGLATPLDSLVALEGNPRIGNIDAIKASLDEFGQLKPIVVKPNADGTSTIIAGNHTAQAARRLGWTHIAAVANDVSDEEAIAFALVDNRVADLGRVDPELLTDNIVSVLDEYATVFEAVGWDDFEIAGIESKISVETEVATGQAGGYVPPVLVNPPAPVVMPVAVANEEGEEGDAKFIAPEGSDHRSLVTTGVGGATSQGPNAKRAAVQYTLVFDDSEQLKHWWDFVGYLRSSSVYEGDTIAARLMEFIDAHSDF